jgi:hypothetical protein
MHHQDRNVGRCEIVVELGFGEGLDTVILGLDATHHPLLPPVLSNSLGDDPSGTVEAVERHRDVFVGLGTMARRARHEDRLRLPSERRQYSCPTS